MTFCLPPGEVQPLPPMLGGGRVPKSARKQKCKDASSRERGRPARTKRARRPTLLWFTLIGHVVMQEKSLDILAFCSDSPVADRSSYCSPQMPPRRAVRGLGAHSPHQTGPLYWRQTAVHETGQGSVPRLLWRNMLTHCATEFPRLSWVRREVPSTTASFWSLAVKVLALSNVAVGLPWSRCQT